MKNFVLSVAFLLVLAGLANAQTPFYVVPYQTGPQSGYFYAAPGSRWYYRTGYAYPGIYQQGINAYGLRVNPYGGYATQVQFNAMQMAAVQQRLALRRFYYGY